MNEKNEFALVPRRSGALEKVEPGAKRLLSGMVAETLAVAKKNLSDSSQKKRSIRIVMMDDLTGVLEILENIVRCCLKDVTVLKFTNAKLAYQELLREEPDLFTTDVCHAEPDGDELLRLLTLRNVTFPIFVISATVKKKEELRAGCLGPNLNVTFLPKPFGTDEFKRQLFKQGIYDRREVPVAKEAT